MWPSEYNGLAQWFGVEERRLHDVVPNAANFPASAAHTSLWPAAVGAGILMTTAAGAGELGRHFVFPRFKVLQALELAKRSPAASKLMDDFIWRSGNSIAAEADG